MTIHPININQYPGIDIPKRMNNPLDYEPHPLCIAACKELQAYLVNRKDWREEIDKGKMFGVLIVEMPNDDNSSGHQQAENSSLHQQPKIGYLAAYSGQIGGRSDWEGFVPAVFDYLQPNGYFKTHEAEITQINHTIARLSHNEWTQKAKAIINDLQQQRQQTIAQYQEKMKEAKAKRDARRQEALAYAQEHPGTDKGLSKEEEQAMIKESQFMKAELRRLKKSLAEKTTLEMEYAEFQENLLRMKQLRKTLSDTLQQWLFIQFCMLNSQGESKNLLEIFQEAALHDLTKGKASSQEAENRNESFLSKRISALKMIPPAGSGECCEPKLLQYAFEHHLKPLQMAMFWWGESPKEEIRHHLQYYPACNGKCKPILHWMLPANVFEQSHQNAAIDGTTAHTDIYNKVEILYEDRELAVIHKPEGLLSVPGKDTHQPSIHVWARKKFPHAEGPLIVHRLDMATSGLMVIAKTEFAYHRLQELFSSHQVQKRYIAIICCKDADHMRQIRQKAEESANHRGLISLPLMPDYLDRPRQIVNHEEGKEAITEYEVLGSEERRVKSEEFNSSESKYLRLALYPKTGRTHQLRVHCAHHEGLDAPILGDPLYGNVKADRLYLHAEAIRFKHPLTGKELYIERKADF